MGVHGLWELLAPVGRRVSVETLAGKKLAIDASIWMVQFMKAMRDEKGEMMRNAHLLGFFRRICKLLFLRAKPVFVFDGATPALKRRTLASRRRYRDAAQAKIRKTAEKLLLSHLKARKLEELAEEIKKSGNKKENEKGKQVENTSHAEQEKLDELLAKSLAAEEEIDMANGASTSVPLEEENENEDGDDEEEMILDVTENNIDPAVLASLPPSMQLDLLVQMRERVMAENRQKYQKIKQAPAKFSELQIQSYLKTVAFRREINQVQRIAAGKDLGGVQTSKIASESNREFIFSSSFTGDKQTLVDQVTNGNGDNNTIPNPKLSYDKPKSRKENPVNKPKSGKENPVNKSKFAKENLSNEVAEKEFGPDIETYTDESGRVRVSRVRALGIRMTRDIQRNLDFIREHEQEKNKNINEENVDSSNDLNESENNNFEISFLEDRNEGNDAIDDVFLNLVESDESENIWEEGLIEEEKGNEILEDCNEENDLLIEENSILKEGLIEEEEEEEINEISEDCNKGNDAFIQENIILEEGLIEEEEEKRNEISEDYNKENDVSVKENSISEEGLIGEEEEEEEEKNEISKDRNKENDVLIEEQSILEEAIEENNKKENEIIIEENSNEGDEVDWEDGNCEIISSTTKISKEDSVEEDNKSENRISIGENDNKGEDIEWEDGNSEIISSNLQKLSKGVLEEDALMQEAIKRSLEDTKINTNENDNSRETHHVEVPSDKLQEIAEDSIADKRYSEEQVEKISPVDYLSNDINETIFEPNFDEEISLLRREQRDLGEQRRKLESHAESVTSEMFSECQELLQMFGLPYIIAPTEAEAQCAFMEMNNLVDGVVTDDSDAFLFGAKSVYKNIFDDRKYVETYFMKDIESELGLNRDLLIRMAMLLGSDYTPGISGIGIVNAIEVVHAFPEEDGLKKFREWIESPDPNILGSFDKSSKKNSSTKNNSSENEDVIKETFMSKHRNVSKNWHLPSTFPSEAVINAYISPQIDDSKETFSWGKPDVNLLRKLCWEKFGWNIQKADDLLVPVLKEHNKHETQMRLEAFYTFNERFAKVRSQRIKKAIKGITGNHFPGLDNPEKDVNLSKGQSSSHSKGKKKEQEITKTRKRKNARGKTENVEPIVSSGESSDENGSQNDTSVINDMAELRRSKRQRKGVKYNEEEIEVDNLANLEPEINDIDKEVENNEEANLNNVENYTNDSEMETLPKDYLYSGGGFCDDEGNENGEGEGNQKMDVVLDESVEPGNEMPDLSGGAAEEDTNETNVASDVNDDLLSLGGKGRSGLSAMPFLKRRKR